MRLNNTFFSERFDPNIINETRFNLYPIPTELDTLKVHNSVIWFSEYQKNRLYRAIFLSANPQLNFNYALDEIVTGVDFERILSTIIYGQNLYIFTQSKTYVINQTQGTEAKEISENIGIFNESSVQDTEYGIIAYDQMRSIQILSQFKYRTNTFGLNLNEYLREELQKIPKDETYPIQYKYFDNRILIRVNQTVYQLNFEYRTGLSVFYKNLLNNPDHSKLIKIEKDYENLFIIQRVQNDDGHQLLFSKPCPLDSLGNEFPYFTNNPITTLNGLKAGLDFDDNQKKITVLLKNENQNFYELRYIKIFGQCTQRFRVAYTLNGKKLISQLDANGNEIGVQMYTQGSVDKPRLFFTPANSDLRSGYIGELEIFIPDDVDEFKISSIEAHVVEKEFETGHNLLFFND